MRRARDTRVSDDFAPVETVETQTTTYAGRALVGWSWLIAGRAFISLAAGASYGYERGSEVLTPDTVPPMSTRRPVARSHVSGEAFFRLGVTFGR